MNWMTRCRPLAIPCAAACAVLLLSACVYSIDIQQGNFLEAKEIDRVAVGMTRVQVRSLLGTPMVSDPFEGARWDYVYYLKPNRSREITRQHFIVFFEGDKVSRIDRADRPEDAAKPVEDATTAAATTTTDESNPSSSTDEAAAESEMR